MKLDSRMPEGEKIKGVPLVKDGQNLSLWFLLLHFFHYEEHFMNKNPSLCALCSASKPAPGKEAKGSTELQLDSESEEPEKKLLPFIEL